MRYEDYVKPLSSESNLALAQALNMQTVKGKDGHITLMQANQTNTVHTNLTSSVNTVANATANATSGA